MKKIGTVSTIMLFIVAVTISYFAGDYMSDKSHKEVHSEQFGKYMSRAIDTVEDKGLSLEGASEAIASNVWVAHELCDNPKSPQSSATCGMPWSMKKTHLQVRKMHWHLR